MKIRAIFETFSYKTPRFLIIKSPWTFKFELILGQRNFWRTVATSKYRMIPNIFFFHKSFFRPIGNFQDFDAVNFRKKKTYFWFGLPHRWPSFQNEADILKCRICCCIKASLSKFHLKTWIQIEWILGPYALQNDHQIVTASTYALISKFHPIRNIR